MNPSRLQAVKYTTLLTNPPYTPPDSVVFVDDELEGRSFGMDGEGRPTIGQDIRTRLSALGPAGRAALLRTLTASDVDRAARIKTFYDDPMGRGIAELLMDLEEDVAARGTVIAELHAMEREDG